MYPDFIISSFHGTNTAIKDTKALKPGFSPDSVNWLTSKEEDSIALRRGYKLLGQTRVDGSGEVTGIGVGLRYDGIPQLFYSHGRKVKYYNRTTDDTQEVDIPDILPVAADGEEVWFESYQGLSGSFVYFGSPNSSVYKVPAANPGSVVDQIVGNYRWGVFHIGQNRAFAGQRNGISPGNIDPTGLYLSYIDHDQLSDYYVATPEVIGTGTGAATTYIGTLNVAQYNIPKGKTVMYPSISAPVGSAVSVTSITSEANASVQTSGPHGFQSGDFVTFYGVGGMTQINGIAVQITTTDNPNIFLTNLDTTGFSAYTAGGSAENAEVFFDSRNGTFTSNLGGTGTVNYATAEYSVTFASAPSAARNVTATYYYESSQNNGILDFTGNGNGQGKSFRQDDGGGNLMAIFNISTVEYCLHLLKTWQFQSSLDDTDSTNLPYRNVGIPNPKAVFQTPKGIILADLASPDEPKYRQMEVLGGTNINTIEPLSISDDIDLLPFSHDGCVAYRWGDYDIFCFQEKLNGVANDYNSGMWIRNRVSKRWDRVDYYANVLVDYDGMLIAGDSVSNNCYVLFSGYDEDGDIMSNYWKSGDHNLGSDNLKNCRRMVVDGLIQPNQSLEVWLAYDQGEFSRIFTIEGDAEYVDSGIDTYIGGETIGSKTIGSGGSSVAHPFTVDFPINSDRFCNVQTKLVAVDIGYVSVNKITFKDIRDKGRKNTPTRTR